VSDREAATTEHTVARIRKAGSTAWGMGLDVSDAPACMAFAQQLRGELGPIAILVNNAGVGGETPIDSPEAQAQWDLHIAVNLSGMFHTARAFAGALRETRGSIVNLASLASFTAVTGSHSYMASKGGVKMLTQSLAKQFAADGIRVNAVAPGVIDTPMMDRRKNDAQWMAAFRTRTPMGRLGLPAEVADPVLFLVSPMAAYITGVTLPIDGGYLAT